MVWAATVLKLDTSVVDVGQADPSLRFGTPSLVRGMRLHTQLNKYFEINELSAEMLLEYALFVSLFWIIGKMQSS